MKTEQTEATYTEGEMIKDVADLALHLGANEATGESISHRVYKDTECGAWAHLTTERLHPRYEKWGIWLHMRGGRVVFHHSDHDGTDHTWEETPEEAQAFLVASRPSLLGQVVTDPEAIALCKNIGLGSEPQRFEADVLTYDKPVNGVAFGSIVEGVDETTTTHFVPFPCTPEAIDKAIQAVEDEARDIRNRTHGCPYCYHDGDEDAWGTDDYPAVNPECAHCGGSGIIL